MKLGVFAKTFEGETPGSVLAAAAAAGYEAVQYNMACSGIGPLPLEVSGVVADAVAEAAAASRLDIVAMSATYNMIHPDLGKREAGRRSFEAIAAAAQRMGSPMITVCSGSRDAQDQWRAHPDNDSSEAWREMIREFRLLVPIAERYGLLIGVEPEFANVVSSPARARMLLDLFPSGPIRIVLDSANLFEHGTTESARKTIEAAVELVGHDIGLAHAKDRKADGTLVTAGKGAVDFDHYVEALRSVGFDGALVTHGLSAAEGPAVARFLGSKIGR